MNSSVGPVALMAALLVVAQPASATPIELALKCRNGSGGSDWLAFLPIPEAVEGGEYTPRVLLRPGSDEWNLRARWEFNETTPERWPVVYLLDGRVVDEDAYTRVASDIDGIYISCSDIALEALGIEPGHTLVVIFTYPVLDLLRNELRAIEAKQGEFVDANGRFARSLEELGVRAGAEWVLELTTSEDGSSWSAAGRHVLLDDRDSITVSGER